MDQPSSSRIPPLSEPEIISVPTPIIKGPFISESSTQTNKLELGQDQLEESRKWNEERIERRLRGEYERAGKALSELVMENLETPLRINAIRVVGAKITKPSFLSTVLSPYLPSLPPPTYFTSTPIPSPSTSTLKDVLETSKNLTNLLNQFEIFSKIETKLEKSLDGLAEIGDVDLILSVKEVPRFYLRTATDIGDGEGSATGTARIKNAFGGAEMIEGNVSFGTRTKSAFQLKIDTPVNGSPTTKADLSIFSSERDLSHYANCAESTKGISTRLRTISQLGFHEFSYEAVLRKIGNIGTNASVSIRESAGESIKSCISHTLVRDTRNDSFLATTGSYFKTKQEFAGLGGDVNFLKIENEISISREIFNGLSMSLSGKSGLLYGGNNLFVDRFQLGGPTSIRMFGVNSIGPRDGNDFIGGDLSYSLGLSLYSPVPFLNQYNNLKLHYFLNLGKLNKSNSNKSLLLNSIELFNEPIITTGLGLIFKHSLVRIEGNIGVPITSNQNLKPIKGLQFGLGLSFL